MSPPMDLSALVAKARAPAGIASPERLAAESRIEHLEMCEGIATAFRDTLPLLPTEALMAWGQAIADNGAELGPAVCRDALGLLRAEMDGRAGEHPDQARIDREAASMQRQHQCDEREAVELEALTQAQLRDHDEGGEGNG